MLAVTRLENDGVLNTHNQVEELFKGFRLASRSYPSAPTYYSTGVEPQEHNLDSQNLCLTKTGCNSSARLCPLKILLCIANPI